MNLHSTGAKRRRERCTENAYTFSFYITDFSCVAAAFSCICLSRRSSGSNAYEFSLSLSPVSCVICDSYISPLATSIPGPIGIEPFANAAASIATTDIIAQKSTSVTTENVRTYVRRGLLLKKVMIKLPLPCAGWRRTHAYEKS